MAPVSIDVWSDLACPWCYVGKRRLEAALTRFSQAAQVEIRWRAFELNPAAEPVEARRPYAERLARKYGTALAEAQEMIDRMRAAARADGLELDFERIRPGNTFDAHRLVRLAAERGLAEALQERLFRAYFCEGEAIGDRGVLLRLGTESGLEPGAVESALAGEAYAAEVRADEDEARSLGIRGVPHFRFDSRSALSGAQPAEVLLAALEEAARP